MRAQAARPRQAARRRSSATGWSASSTLDFGRSMWTGRPVSDEIAIRLELSLQVAIMATIIAILIAIPLGTLSALYQNTWIDYVVRVLAIAGLAVPSFWLGMLIILALLLWFDWMPPHHLHAVPAGPAAEPLAADLAGARGRLPLFRGGDAHDALDAARGDAEDYIRTARAKGVFERLVVARHAMRNALLPVVTVIGLEFAFLIGGLVVTEQVFNLNGIGKLFVEATSRGDYTMIQALVMLVAAFFILINFVVDLLYAALDPRIRYG